MDLIAITREKVERAGDGEHASGLKAVMLHIETAVSHLERGQDTSDETAFTDAIYRTNQAFEGSLKEAYRVLTGSKPEKKTPFQIEEHFTTHDIFRSRVLAQFKNYRTEWRNPSTHDHKLDFDASESFLAIVSVCAFANLLLDQIIEKLAHDRSKLAAESEKDRLASSLKSSEKDLALFTANLISEFISQHEPQHDSPRMREAEFLGALSGFIESIAPKLQVGVDTKLEEKSHARADLLIERPSDRLIVELKGMKFSRHLLRHSLEQLDRYFDMSGIDQGVLVISPPPYEKPVISETRTPGGRRIVAVVPADSPTFKRPDSSVHTLHLSGARKKVDEFARLLDERYDLTSGPEVDAIARGKYNVSFTTLDFINVGDVRTMAEKSGVSYGITSAS